TSNTDIGEATTLLKLGAIDFIVKDEELLPNLLKTMEQVAESRKLRGEMARNKLLVKKYKKRLLIISLVVAVTAVILIWLFS
ncbi:MAG TPA: hypothetical protein PK892_08000, partial [Bacteroidales bacterium]|nr:hypothetical protein [Bacteroidales bacterium]